MPQLKGFNYKKEQLKAADEARNIAKAAEKTRRDREYDLRVASEKADTTAIAEDGAEACATAANEARQLAERLAGEQEVLVDKLALRKKKGEIKAATAKAELLQSLADTDEHGREHAISTANQAVIDARDKLQEAAEKASKLDDEATELKKNADALPDLHASWAKDHSNSSSARALEADLRNMKEDLTRLGSNAPPGAKAYCNKLETTVDYDAHHVPCSRCNTKHGIDRTAEAKDAVAAQVKELERLAKLPDNTGLSPQQDLDRSIGLDLETLRGNKGGKMIGVLLCEDQLGQPVTLRAFSGDSAGRDDVDGWCKHIPPGSSISSANGVKVPLAALPTTTGTPHGVCAAPKMIQEAHRRGLTIVSIAEAWYGDGKVQPHGALVASCTTCKSNLDIQLCSKVPSTCKN